MYVCRKKTFRISLRNLHTHLVVAIFRIFLDHTTKTKTKNELGPYSFFLPYLVVRACSHNTLFSRPGQSQGLLYKHLHHSLIN